MIDKVMLGRPKREQWRYEGDRMSLEDGEFDYDLNGLEVAEEEDQERINRIEASIVRPTKVSKHD